ncbi:MAG TPA: hypothetical protein VL401_01460 [Alphaproteobacteria bacterium]|jgi:hypothetical protein|nr:hypothetical protein [Alphaproteobacteria bacterium]
MEITYLGNSSFKIKAKNATIEISENIEIINTTTNVSKIVSGPGEYEIGGVSIIGYKNNVYVYEFEKLRIASTSSVLPTDAGDIDVLILQNPSKEVIEKISDLEPYFVVTADSEILKTSGLPSETLPKFVLKKEDIGEDQNTKIIVLEKK